MRADAEWLEADGLGGYAMGTVSGLRTRRYHGLLISAASPPTARQLLVAGVEAWVEVDGRVLPISSHRYAPDVIHPDGLDRLVDVQPTPWPTATWRLPHAATIVREVVMVPGRPRVTLRWTLHGDLPGAVLHVRPLLAGRDHHALLHEAAGFAMEPEDSGSAWLRWRRAPGALPVTIAHTGTYHHDPQWYRRFRYSEETNRGFEDTEDLASPGTFRFALGAGAAILECEAGDVPDVPVPAWPLREEVAHRLEAERRRRDARPDRLDRAATAYLARRGSGSTIVAGYPWFTDWGRDTLIALRGLCLARGELDVAGQILHAWAGAVSEGMLPNRFPDAEDEPEYNSVDASLWFVVVAQEWLDRMARAGRAADGRAHASVVAAMQAILHGYQRGTRHGIRMDDDALLAAGVPGLQLTWMDAKVGEDVITPRIGKPVEVQALWINALHAGARHDSAWAPVADRAHASFLARFPDPATGGLVDVVDVDHCAGSMDGSVRPNQVFAVGGLPVPLLHGEAARAVVTLLEQRLLTPMGLRTLEPHDVRYRPRYEGGVGQRDGAYHQGTAWPWLLGPFVEAWVRVHGNTPGARAEARRRFLEPLLAREQLGLGHLPEIADGDPPHLPRGCPFQAWSVAEALRLDREVLAMP